MRKFLGVFLCLLILFTFQWPSSAFAQTNYPNLTNSQIQQLTEIKYNLSTLNDLEMRGVINNETVQSERKYYLNKAKILTNSPLTPEQITNLLEKYQTQEISTPTTWQKFTGFFNFVNIIWIASTILLLIAVGWLISIYILPILFAIPAGFYEFLIYVACLLSISLGLTFTQDISEFIALPGCLGLVGALAFTEVLHQETLNNFYEQNKIDRTSVYPLILFIIWSAVAVIYHSAIIGFIAILALEVFLGFSVLVMPLCYFIGFQDREVIPVATAASFFLMAFYLAVKLTKTDISYLNVFTTGALFLGTFVYFIGLLILSSKWHGHKSKWHYAGLQLLTIVSGVAAIFIGSVWQVSQLNGIGGTFFFLYLLEKYWELPWKKEQWAWATLGLAIILYSGSFVIKIYPQYFLFGV
ncbi:MAG TPA: hypothetical protein VK203_02165 [Nostocaceae cyanobacterium]|nr:hypothetical protein [Nostocaceae cyanobacterium]